MSENVFRIVVVILLSVITLLLLFGLGEGQSCNGGPERQRRHLDLHPDLGRPGYRGGRSGYSPTLATAYSACAWVNPPPSVEVSCWVRLAALNPPICTYPLADSTAWASQSGLR